MQICFFRTLRPALVLLPLALGVAGCETIDKLNPFAEKQTPLPGERQPLFPQGVPGVEFGAPPPQPTNSNIPIQPANQNPPPAAQGAVEQQAARTPPPAQPTPPPASAKGAKGGNPNDAWSGTR